MMRLLRKWLDHERRHFQRSVHEPDEEIVAREKEHMRRDLNQVMRLDEYLLNEAVEHGTISPARAASIRLTQPTENEHDLVEGLRAKVRMRTREA